MGSRVFALGAHRAGSVPNGARLIARSDKASRDRVRRSIPRCVRLRATLVQAWAGFGSKEQSAGFSRGGRGHGALSDSSRLRARPPGAMPLGLHSRWQRHGYARTGKLTGGGGGMMPRAERSRCARALLSGGQDPASSWPEVECQAIPPYVRTRCFLCAPIELALFRPAGATRRGAERLNRAHRGGAASVQIDLPAPGSGAVPNTEHHGPPTRRAQAASVHEVAHDRLDSGDAPDRPHCRRPVSRPFDSPSGAVVWRPNDRASEVGRAGPDKTDAHAPA